ncbi:MAG TPA: hypothetical protein VJB60_01075 [Candidatus Peribacterales bacterium]|nr:hypothetical protein [Candidatus Peribacterales bacterium]
MFCKKFPENRLMDAFLHPRALTFVRLSLRNVLRWPLRILMLAAGCVLPMLTAAQAVPSVTIPSTSFGPLCALTGLCAMSPATGVASIADYLTYIIVPAVKVIFVGVAVIYVSRYALTMILSGGDESAITEQREAFGDAARGMAFAGIASFIVNTFAPSAAGVALVNPGPFVNALNLVADFLTIVTGAFLIFVISFAGFRLIVLQGDEGEIEKQKKNFFNGLIGIALLFTARVIVLAILPTGSPVLLVDEIGGMIRFLLEIIAGLAVTSIIVSGVLFVVSLHNDGLRQRARRILTSTVIVLVIVILSHLLVAVLLPPTAPPSTI